MVKCSSPNCDKPAGSLKCPTCTKKGLPDALFCSQECFTNNWKAHKKIHALAKTLAQQSQRARDPFSSYAYTGGVRKGQVSAKRDVPADIERPVYVEREDRQDPRERDDKGNGRIHVNSAEEIAIMREACRMGREILDMVGAMVAPGVSTEDIDAAVHQRCVELRVYPSPLEYSGFPKSCCTSVNEVVCHGIPDSTVLKDGDIINIDISIFHKGMHADLNATYPVGTVSHDAKKLVRVTYECLDLAIKACKPGFLYRNLGAIIQKHAHKHKLSVITSYCGHGVGTLFHGPPTVPHYKGNKAVGVMRPGHIFTIEPMINLGTYKDTLWPDDWTSVTRDGKWSAQFEETLLVTETGVEVLTKGSYVPEDFR